MAGLARQTGRSLSLVRTVIEVVGLAQGWVPGGTVGAGTVLYLVAIGPLAHRFVPLFSLPAALVADQPAHLPAGVTTVVRCVPLRPSSACHF